MYSVTNSISVVSELIGSIVKHAVSAASKCNDFATTAVFFPSPCNGLASAVNIRLARKLKLLGPTMHQSFCSKLRNGDSQME